MLKQHGKDGLDRQAVLFFWSCLHEGYPSAFFEIEGYSLALKELI